MREKHAMNSINVVLRMYKTLDTFLQRKVIFLIFLLIGSAVCELLSLGLVIPFVSTIFNSSNEILIAAPFYPDIAIRVSPNTLVGCFATAITFSALFRSYCTWETGIVSAKIGNFISLLAVNKFFKGSFESSLSVNNSTLIAVTTKYTDELVLTTLSTMQFLGSVFVSICLFVGVILSSPLLALCSALFFGSIYVCINHNAKPIVVRNSHAIANIFSNQIQLLQEMGSNNKIISLGSHQNFFSNKFADYDQELRRKTAQNFFIGYAPKYFLESAGIIAITLGVYLFINSENNLNSEVIFSQIALLAFAAQKLLPALQQMYNTASVIKSKHESILRIINFVSKTYAKIPYQRSINPLRNYNSSLVEFKDVTFSYKTNPETSIVKHLSFKIQKDDRIALTGPTGSGKSTIVDLLVGLLEPSSGSIFVYGNDLETSGTDYITTWMNSISYIPQKTYLSNDSIIKNVAYGVPEDEINVSRLRDCCRLACIDKFIESLPNSYYEKIVENGTNISGGQAQRLGIARALYHNGEVIIMDESTSALDKQTELQVMQNVSNMSGKTLIIISHREIPLSFCNKFYNVKDNLLSYNC